MRGSAYHHGRCNCKLNCTKYLTCHNINVQDTLTRLRNVGSPTEEKLLSYNIINSTLTKIRQSVLRSCTPLLEYPFRMDPPTHTCSNPECWLMFVDIPHSNHKRYFSNHFILSDLITFNKIRQRIFCDKPVDIFLRSFPRFQVTSLDETIIISHQTLFNFPKTTHVLCSSKSFKI